MPLPRVIPALERAVAHSARVVARTLPRRAGAFERDAGDLAALLRLREDLLVSHAVARIAPDAGTNGKVPA